MGHVDPLVWIPMGGGLAVLFTWVAVTEPTGARIDWTVRLFDRLFGRRVTNVIIRVGSVGLAIGSGWFAVHGVLALLPD